MIRQAHPKRRDQLRTVAELLLLFLIIFVVCLAASPVPK